MGIETSCDETAAAVVEDGVKILSNVVASQIDIHREFGGVVPEVAARSHIEVILPVIQKSLDRAKLAWGDIDGIAVTAGPGLPGALLVGVLTARTLAIAKNKPLYAINHVEAHTYANWLFGDSSPQFPVLALIVSGGHSQLVLFEDHLKYRLLGQTLDDAVGEAFDKVAKLLGLGFPGGPAVAEAAKAGDEQAFVLPTPHTDKDYDFSFSGLKTAVLRQLQTLLKKDYNFPSYQVAAKLTSKQVNDMAASFQQTAVKILVDHTLKAFGQYQPKTVVIAGGVAANQKLRQELQKALPIKINFPPINLCTDNAAMIAACAFWHAGAGEQAKAIELETNPSLVM